MRKSETLPALVIGAGQAGLAAGYHLQRADIPFVILEASNEPGGSWPNYYDNLRLFSPTRYSSLPGLPFPGHPDHYPHRDEVIAYLRQYASHFRLPIVTRAAVRQIQFVRNQFMVQTADDSVYAARTLVAATGSFHAPHIPRLPGQRKFRGQIMHSASYRNSTGFASKRVIVVGAGNSAVQIAVELSQVADVTLAARQPVQFIRQRILGCDLHCWLQWSGLDFAPWIRDQNAPVLDAGVYRKAFAAKQPDQRSMFLKFTETGVVWPDSRHEPVDLVIFATGYRPNFRYLANLDALDARGAAIHRRGISTVVPGLYFVGISGQRSFRSATLRGVGHDAKYVVRTLHRRLVELDRTSGPLDSALDGNVI